MGPQSRQNWLDQFRLGFAALVILTHSFDLLGRNAEEPLRRALHYDMGFGGPAVWAFFILSGYLITRSWTAWPDWIGYLRNRLLRIAPAYTVAFVLSVIVVGAIGAANVGAYFAALDWPNLASELVSLQRPTAPFPGPYPEVNGAMWTIQSEFLCYLLVPLLTFRRQVTLAAWAICAALAISTSLPVAAWGTMFLSGALYFQFGLTGRRPLIWVCLAALALCRLGPTVALFVFATAGTYALLSVGLMSRPGPKLPDLSYGTYLYGWPVQKLVILAGGTSPWLVFALSLPLSLAAGAASWFGIEQRALRHKARAETRSSGRASEAAVVVGRLAPTAAASRQGQE